MYILSIFGYDITSCTGILYVVHKQHYQSGLCMLKFLRGFSDTILLYCTWHTWAIALKPVLAHQVPYPSLYSKGLRAFVHDSIHRFLVFPLPELGSRYVHAHFMFTLDVSTDHTLLQHHVCLHKLTSWYVFVWKSHECIIVLLRFLHYALCSCLVANDICGVMHCVFVFRW